MDHISEMLQKLIPGMGKRDVFLSKHEEGQSSIMAGGIKDPAAYRFERANEELTNAKDLFADGKYKLSISITSCSNMARSGMNSKTLRYLMGHSDIGVTMNTYTHLGLADAQEKSHFILQTLNRRNLYDPVK